MTRIDEVKSVNRALQVQFEDGVSLSFEDCWLRDNCRCPSCYYADKTQRVRRFQDVPDARISSVHNNKSNILIIWDDGHRSTFTGEFLAKFEYKKWMEGRRLKPIYWKGEGVMDNVTRIHVNEFLHNVEGAKGVFRSILDYGFAFIEGVKPTIEATEEVVTALGGVQHTILGGMWCLSQKENPEDLGYTNLPLSAHTDSTYFVENSGLQTFHCLKHEHGTGGETTLVDGFYGALRLKTEHPEDFKFLTTFEVESEYMDDNHHQKHSAPVIGVSRMQDLVYIRFKTYDRAPMVFRTGEECRSFYRSLRNLLKYYDDPDHQVQLKLKPGVVLIVDNFRVLHGRTGFNGERVLCGGSVTRSDWLSRARVLGLIQ